MIALVAHLGFESFAKNESVNFEAGKDMGFMNQEGNFIRKGKCVVNTFTGSQMIADIYRFCVAGETGDWKNHFSAELNDRVDKWIEKNLEGTDLKFVAELK